MTANRKPAPQAQERKKPDFILRSRVRPARLGAAMPANDLRQDYVRAVVREDDGALVATPFGIQDSSMLRMLADANGLIVRAPFAPAATAGEACSVLMLR